MSGVKPARSGERFYKVPVAFYRPGDLIDEDLYFLYQGRHVLYRLKNLPWKAEDSSYLSEFGIHELYIVCEEVDTYRQFMETHLGRILDEPTVPESAKANILYESMLSVVEDVFVKPEARESVKRGIRHVHHSIEYLGKDSKNFFHLMELAQRNFSELSHALHTTAYAVQLARQVGVKSFNDLSAIGIAALLHDVGKVRIDSRILEKEDFLDESERAEVEKHPLYSHEIVRTSRTVPSLAETIILQHHERLHGKGYPRKLDGEIHLYSKIVALCDCYDSMTSDRKYAKALKSVEAIEKIRSEQSDDYDAELIRNFILMLKR